MTKPRPPAASTRRDFLTGRSVRLQVERAGDELADALVETISGRTVPMAGDTLRLSTRAMACDWSIVLNPGTAERIMVASDALDLVQTLEDQMSVYRSHSELSRLNSQAFAAPVPVEARLFDLLQLARRLSLETERAFDPTSGPLVALWRSCRREGRIPTQDEIAAGLERTGIEHVGFDDAQSSVRFARDGLSLDLGAIGKGHAVDRAGEYLSQRGLDEWLIHGGYSSILARGDHQGNGGWPVGLRNPLFTAKRYATIVLKDRALATSGSNIQYFRHGGRRYGHILDPRTGWPAEQLLSVTVVAPTAAMADALSTAFFVGGVENAHEFCDNHPDVGAVLVPHPTRGRHLEPILIGMAEEDLFFA